MRKISLFACLITLLFAVTATAQTKKVVKKVVKKPVPVMAAKVVKAVKPMKAVKVVKDATKLTVKVPVVTPKENTVKETSKEATKETKSTEKKDSWWKVLIGGLIQILLLFVLAISTGIGGLMIKWLAKKMKITDQEQIKNLESILDLLVTAAVNYGNQMAKKLSDDPDANGKRMKWALDFVQKGIEDLSLPQKSADWLKKKIEAKIGSGTK